MPFKLKASKPAPPSWYHEYEFDKDFVTIGRETRCNLQLEGINSVVSREHHRISGKRSDQALNGLQWRDSTSLDGTGVDPGGRG